jgi:hypothetical protein
MPFGTASEIFRSFVNSQFTGGAHDFMNNDFKAALYTDAATPDQNAAGAAYGAGAWIAGNEVTSSTDWPVKGKSLGGKAVNQATAATVFVGAENLASGTNATLTNVWGALVYNDANAADLGLCYNAFGGAQSVTAGTFTIVWSASGIARITL